MYTREARNSYGNKPLLGIEVADPGAVPGASTMDKYGKISLICYILRERNRIDVLNKGVIFTQNDSSDHITVIWVKLK